LAREFGAICVTPTGWTTASGSDYHIDKIFLASKYYELNGDGEIVEISYVDEPNSELAMANRLVNLYRAAVTYHDAFAKSTFPTDVQTALIKDYIVKMATSNLNALDYATLDYNINFHGIVADGAAGLGAAAIAKSSNSIFSNFDITLDKDDSSYEALHSIGLDKLSNPISHDGVPVGDYLNGLISGFVDSIKNPFIFYSNIGGETLNAILYAIRAGFGRASFALALQPILMEMQLFGGRSGVIKEYMNRLISRLEIREMLEARKGPVTQEVQKESEKLKALSGDVDDIINYIRHTYMYKPLPKKEDRVEGEDYTSAHATDRLKDLMTFERLDKIAKASREPDHYTSVDDLIDQLIVISMFSSLNNAGKKLSEASRFHNCN
jgi:hypothetical protein